MLISCPACGAEMTLDVLLAHEDSRRMLARLVTVGVPLGALVMRYIGLFRPGKRQLTHGRVVTLIDQMLPDMERAAIERKGRLWAAPREVWRVSLEAVLEARDKGALDLPLRSHGYLYEVIASHAGKGEAQAERDVEAQRRARAHVAGPAPLAEVLAPSLTAAPVAAVPTPAAGPSRAARKLQAEIAARRAQRGGDAPADQPAT